MLLKDSKFSRVAHDSPSSFVIDNALGWIGSLIVDTAIICLICTKYRQWFKETSAFGAVFANHLSLTYVVFRDSKHGVLSSQLSARTLNMNDFVRCRLFPVSATTHMKEGRTEHCHYSVMAVVNLTNIVSFFVR